MADLAQYYQAVNEAKKELDTQFPSGFLYVTAVRNVKMNNMTGGTVTEVTTRKGAQHLVDITAKISTPAEIEAFKERAAEFSAKMATNNFLRKQSEAGGVYVLNGNGVLPQ